MIISEPSGPRKTYTEISSNDPNSVVKEILDILPDAGETDVIGALRQKIFMSKDTEFEVQLKRWILLVVL